ncbi:uncharacterized protein TNCV_1962761 [Trichonephila clavipes]|nr:uncharacterized protein TNCV_1962761 [Trichonephila clavipes]
MNRLGSSLDSDEDIRFNEGEYEESEESANIGHGGPVHWPPRIARPFLSGLFLLGANETLVFETPVNSAEELVARISAAAGEIRNTPEMLSNVRRSMKRRCEACITCGGRQLEHLL